MERDLYRRHFELEESHWWFRGRRDILLAVLVPRLAAGRRLRILDAGCGTGYNLKMLAPFGEAFGCDISADALAFCRRRGLTRLARADAGRLPFAGGSFDLVTLLDVLYHKAIRDDVAVLGETARVLKPGGLLLITDSAFRALSGGHDRAFHARERYTREVLAARVERAGLEVLKAGYFNFFLFPLVYLVRRLESLLPARPGPRGSDLRPAPAWLNGPLAGLLRIESRLVGRLDLPFGSSVLCLAAKPAPGTGPAR